MHIRTAVWTAVGCVAIWFISTVYWVVEALKSAARPETLQLLLWHALPPAIGQAGILLFLVVLGLKGGRSGKNSRRKESDGNGNGGERWPER